MGNHAQARKTVELALRPAPDWLRARVVSYAGYRLHGAPPRRKLFIPRVITVPHAPDRNWADLAALCGYHDQSHLSREFRALTGLTANQFRRLATTPGDTTAAPVHGRIVTVRPC